MKFDFYRYEKRSVFSLALIFGFRMLGLFMVLPIFSVVANDLSGSTSFLIGLALGIYGLTQALFQIPMSMLSDYIGRKSIIALGLSFFFLGSIVAAQSTSIAGVIVGRSLQGAGAVGSVVLALLADVTKVENRTYAMAIVGMSIGISFMVAMIISPIIYELGGLSGLFWGMAALALLGIFILYFGVSNPDQFVFNQKNESLPKGFRQIFFRPELMRLNLGIFLQHAILTASFVGIPKLLSQEMHLPPADYWMFYLPVLLFASVGAFPVIFFSEKRQCVRGVLIASIMTLGLTQFLLACHFYSVFWVIPVLSIFFLAFTILEAFLPSLVTKIAPIKMKGSAMGIYSTSQFLGIFLGGALGGALFFYLGLSGVFWFCSILAILWLFVAIFMKSPPYLVTRIYKIGEVTSKEAAELSRLLLSVSGVSEVAVISSEGAVYLKVDLQSLDEVKLGQYVRAHS